LGLADDGHRLARTYSGGMRRRLDLGASLVGTPRLLLLDEPTTGLDPRSRMELWDTIRALVAAGTDVLLTTQYLDEADAADLPRAADMLARLHDGAVSTDEGSRRVTVGVDSGSDGLMQALRSIEDAGVAVEDIAMRQPNLDEVFLALTRRAA